MFGQSKNSKKYFSRNKFQTFNTNLENKMILILQKEFSGSFSKSPEGEFFWDRRDDVVSPPDPVRDAFLPVRRSEEPLQTVGRGQHGQWTQKEDDGQQQRQGQGHA